MLRLRFIFPIFFLAFFSMACSGKKRQEREDKARSMMQNFFQAPVIPGMPATGLWIVDQESAAAVIEKKYLAGYVAKPDEMQASEIRERLKSLTIYFHVQSRQMAMLTMVADSVGVSTGEMTPRPAAANAFDVLMRGKGESQRAVLRYQKKGQAETLEYAEGGLVMKATRETRPTAELVEFYLQRLKSSTGLTQY